MLSNRRAQSVIGLLIAVVIVVFMFVILLKGRKPAGEDSIYKDAGVDTSSYKSTLDSARKIAADAAKPRE